MATLPDLDTSSIGYIAYWNAIDQGAVASIDPDEVLSDGNIIDYTIYDNGVEGNYSTLTGRTMTFRVKNDGWMIVYTDRTNEFATQESNQSNVEGYWDFANDWSNRVGPSEFTQNTGERTINALRAQLPNAGSMTYNTSDVGLYNYEFTSATNTTWLAHWSGNQGFEDNFSRDGGVIYTASTTRLYWAAVSSIDGQGSNASANFEGVTIVNSGGDQYGSIDIIDRGVGGDPETEYILHTEGNSGFEDNGGEGHSGLLAMWN